MREIGLREENSGRKCKYNRKSSVKYLLLTSLSLPSFDFFSLSLANNGFRNNNIAIKYAFAVRKYSSY